MAKKSKLLAALDAQKGRDYDAEKRKKQVKQAEKRKREKLDAADGSDSDEEIETTADDLTVSKRKRTKKAEVETTNKSKASKLSKPSESEENSEEDSIDEEDEGVTIPQPEENIDASASEAEQDSDVPLSDLEDEDMEDTVPHQRLTINNASALLASKKRIAIEKTKIPFHFHNSLVSDLPPSETAISDPNDDLTRELEFYRIARDGVVAARSLFKKEKIPFTRPTDYFAEMVKSDEHMGKVKKKLYDEAAGKKASEEARKLRDAKKFGKAVQIAKEQERAKEKRATLDNIKELKKRRKGQTSTNTNEADDLFQEISVENGNGNDSQSRKRDRSSLSGSGARDGENFKRQRRDSKYGFGGKKRFSKSGDAVSSADMSGFSSSRMKGGSRGGSRGGRGGGRGGADAGRGGKRPTTRRLGKSKRAAGRS